MKLILYTLIGRLDNLKVLKFKITLKLVVSHDFLISLFLHHGLISRVYWVHRAVP